MATITGTSGNDTLLGTSGNDVIDGRDGDDRIEGDFGTDTLSGGNGADFITDYGGGGFIYGGHGADTIFVTPYSDMVSPLLIDGGDDNDQISFGSPQLGKVTIVGGAGSDTVTLYEVTDTISISLGASRDTLSLAEGYFSRYGSQQIAMNAITISDFAVGNSGDVFDWISYLGSSLIGWDQTSNPFRAGFARLSQSGPRTLVQIDIDGSGTSYGFQNLIILENVTKAQLTSGNFGGYAPTGANVAGRTINGTTGDDFLRGTLGADQINGGAGGDTLWSGAGSDRVFGGDGDDFLLGEVGHDTLIGGDGNDTLDGGEGDDLLEGGVGIDHLSGGRGNDIILGGDGDDFIDDSEGSNRIDGGAGNDEIIASSWGSNDVRVIGGSGNDTIRIDTNSHAVVDAGSGDDRFEYVNALGGLVDLTLGTGSDSLAFWVGVSRQSTGITVRDFEVGPWGDRIDWGSWLESDLVGWDGSSNPFSAGYLRLVQSGTSTLVQVDHDRDNPGFGYATLFTLENVVASHLTSENLGGYSLIPVKVGTSSANTLIGGAAAEQLNGLAGNDWLLGNGGNDVLVADTGNDILDGGTGADRMYGGSGNDVFRVDNVSDRVFELSGQGTDRIESKVTFALPDHVEDMTLVGSAAINATGNGLANQLTGNSAGNVLRGGDGNDILYGGEAADRMEGGKHDDLYYVDDAGDVVVELSGQGTDTVMSRIAHTLAANVENLTLHGGGAISGTGNTLANTITGNAAANRLDGGAGADTMIGGSGHDTYVIDHVSDVVVEEGSGGVDSVYSAVDYRLPTHFEKLYLTGTAGRDGRANSMDNILVGNSGGNLLNGGSGDDRIDGGAGNDLIYGHTGKDDLTGGAGADRFLFNTDLAASNVDRIRDFSVVDDRIDLADYVFTRAGGRGALAASAFRTGTAAGDASDRIVYDSASGNLFYDPDGTGAAAQMLFAVVNAGTALTHADFYVYG